ncbi:MAG: TIM barrel protein [Bacteroidota bacterium]
MLRLHNAMWPGLVGKGPDADEPAISLQRMIELTASTEANGEGYDGIDFILLPPHWDRNFSNDQIHAFADEVQGKGLSIGSVVAPVWDGSAMGSAEQRQVFLDSVRQTCEVCQLLNEHGVRQYGVIRIDSADSPANWSKDPVQNTKQIAATFREAARIAADYGERLAAEGEICWAAMHSWRHMLDLLEEVGMPGQLGFQADLAHTYLYLMGYNAPEHALVSEGYSDEAFWSAYREMTNALAPWTIDFHVAQSDGTVFGSGSHDKTGRHCTPDTPNGKLDVPRCATYWLLDDQQRIRNNIKHICWDGCMFPNETLESPSTWQKVLELMQEVRTAVSAAAQAN